MITWERGLSWKPVTSLPGEVAFFCPWKIKNSLIPKEAVSPKPVSARPSGTEISQDSAPAGTDLQRVVSKPGLEGFSATSLCSWNSISQVIPLGISCHHSLCPLLLAQLKILNSCKSHPYILLLFAPCVSMTADLTCFLLFYWLVPFCVPLFFDDTESLYVTLASLEF